jgi:hypothetical protein
MLLAGSTRFLFLRARGGRAGARGLTPTRWHHFPPRSLGLIRRVCDHVVTGSSMWGDVSPHPLTRCTPQASAAPRGVGAAALADAPLNPVALFGLSPQRPEQQGNASTTAAQAVGTTEPWPHSRCLGAMLQPRTRVTHPGGEQRARSHRPLQTRYRFARLPSG